MPLGLTYIVVVLGGPLVFLALIWPAPTPRRFALGVMSAIMLVAAAWLLQGVGADKGIMFVRLICLWMGWIVTIAMIVQAIALKHGFGRHRKWSVTVGAAATIMPWLGLSVVVSAAG